MTAAPIAFRTNTGKYNFSGTPRLINAYAEAQGKDGKDPFAVVPCAGMVLFAEVTDTPCRGMIYLDDEDFAISVHSSSVYKVLSDGTSTRLGTIPGNDIVQLSRNQADPVQISIHCNAGEYYISSDAVYQVIDTELPTAVSQDHIDGYTVYGISDRRFFISNLNECQTIDGTDFETAAQSPDPLVRVKADGDLFIFKQKSTEVWRDTGATDFPFEALAGADMRKGLLAGNAVVQQDNTLFFPGHDNVVYRLTGYVPQRVSNHGIERTIESDTLSSSMIGFSHSSEGHSFVHFTGTDWTRSFDAATQFWHDRESYGQTYWRARFSIQAWGKRIVGDALTGNLYYLDAATFTEGSDPIVWGVDFPTLHVFPNGGIVDALYLDVATGVGTLPATSQGYDPILMLDWSTDGGNSFKGNRHLKLGKWGDRVRVVTRRLGRFGPQGIVFRLRVSDPVVRAIIAADVSIRPLKK